MSLTFWKPGTVGPGSTLDRVSDTEAIVISAPPQDSRDRLPIHKHRTVPDIGNRKCSIHLSPRSETTLLRRELRCIDCSGTNRLRKNNAYVELFLPVREYTLSSCNTFRTSPVPLSGRMGRQRACHCLYATPPSSCNICCCSCRDGNGNDIGK